MSNLKSGALVALLLSAFVGGCASVDKPNPADWPNPGNDKGGQRFSTLTQINKQNVSQLQVAWTYNTGDAGNGTTIECTPLVVDGVMYVTTVMTNVVALDAATGQQLWRYDPYAGPKKNWIRQSGGVNRGVAFWSDGRQGGQRRVILGLSDGRLFSLIAKSGLPAPDFGENGIVDLRKGIEWDISRMGYGPTSPPAVFENTIIVGCSTDEGAPSAPGDVRAFDAISGSEVWRFHTIPRPGEPFGNTWPEGAWKLRGGANPWGGFTVDSKNGIVFCGTGSASSDYYGGDRKGDNLFANCVLALNARNGKRLWHFQTTHHDLWDHDNPCPPVLATITRDGKKVDIVAQCTKTGFCYILDRYTGQPIFGVTETPAPPSDVPGEFASPTQPVPNKPAPFAHQGFRDEDATNISPEANRFVLDKLKSLRHGLPNTPPCPQGTVISPGFHGGATWSGASVDPATGILYTNTNETPYVEALTKNGDRWNLTGFAYFNDAQGYPAIKPPWGRLNAIDLSTGEYAWQSILGEFPELTARGIPQTGTENFGGTIVTAGGLVFIGGTKDEMFHAFDKDTGQLLWQTKLPAGGYATPSTYSVNGKQYIVIACGGGGKLRTKSGDTFVAFALP